MYLAQQQDPDILDLLKRANLYSIPIMNVDSLQEIGQRFAKFNAFAAIRKNRHKYTDCADDLYVSWRFVDRSALTSTATSAAAPPVYNTFGLRW